jgi:site-specific DNA-methyltransferase (cytosine-N4-specific)
MTGDALFALSDLTAKPAAVPTSDVVQGDARSVPLPDGSVRLVVTSPPYLGLRDYGSPEEIGSEPTPSEYVEALMRVMDEMARVLTRDGSVFMVIGDKYGRTGGVDRQERGSAVGDPGGRSHRRKPQKGLPGVRDGSLAGMPWRVALAAIDRGWVWRQEIVWHKTNPMPESVRSRCVRAHETVLHFALNAQPYCRPGVTGGGFGHDVWEFAVQGYRDPLGVRHPAVFPEALVRRVVGDWSAPGDMVLDPFAGSGTANIVARRMGRRTLGVELNPEYVEVARRRIGTVEGGEDSASA